MNTYLVYVDGVKIPTKSFEIKTGTASNGFYALISLKKPKKSGFVEIHEIRAGKVVRIYEGTVGDEELVRCLSVDGLF